MKNSYRDLISQTFEFPQREFALNNDELLFHGIDLMAMIREYGTPLRLTYLPSIGDQVNKCRGWFNDAFEKLNYQGKHQYAYCTKSSHFSFVIKECLKNKTHIETSSFFDIEIVKRMHAQGLLADDTYIICNGYKTEDYVKGIAGLIEAGLTNVVPILDNFKEFDLLEQHIPTELQIGIRVASEEDPKFEFYTSRLGVGYKDIVPFYKLRVKDHPRFNLKMMHFFVNTGINDNAYYWNELHKFLRVYADLTDAGAKVSMLDIGGGFPIKNSLAFDFDYAYLITEIVEQIKIAAEEVNAPHPDIFTEFGSFTVGEAGAMIFSILNQKPQNDREKWDMIDGSFMTSLPDTWAINRRFVMLPVNRWDDRYERVFLGGMTCDSDDYYNSEQHVNAIYLPEFDKKETLYVGFFNCGAYQESISGYGGIKHCLIPSAKHVLIDRNEKGELEHVMFREEQTSDSMLNILGY